MTQLLTTVFEADMTVDDMEEVMSKRALTFLKLMDQYHPALKFHEPVVLIRTTQNLISYDSNELWGLDEVKFHPFRHCGHLHTYLCK